MAAGNDVSILNEYAQKNRLEIRYEDVASDGLEHNKMWVDSIFYFIWGGHVSIMCEGLWQEYTWEQLKKKDRNPNKQS